MTTNTIHRLLSNEERKALLIADRWIWVHVNKKFNESQQKMNHFCSVFKKQIPLIMFTIGITNGKRPLREWKTFVTTNPVCSRKRRAVDEQRLKEEEWLLAELMSLISSYSIYISKVSDSQLLWRMVKLLQVSKMWKQGISCLKQLITAQQVLNQTLFNQWTNHNKKMEFCLKFRSIHQAQSIRLKRKISTARWKLDIKLFQECMISQTNHRCQWLLIIKELRQVTSAKRDRGASSLLLFQALQQQLTNMHQLQPIPAKLAQDQLEQALISTRKVKAWLEVQLKNLNSI